MTRLVLALLITALLGGCLPFALFASGSGAAYRGYSQNWGTFVASKNVNAFCLSPKLRLAIWEFEGYFGKKIVMNSGFRDPSYNGKVGGADNSYHMKCEAADFFIPGVDKGKLIAFARRQNLVGGLGCYANRQFIHIDVRSKPRGGREPVSFGGC